MFPSSVVMWKIPLFDADFGEEELAAVQRPLRENWLTMGEITAELESTFADLIGVRHAVAVTNGTCALHLGLLGAGVGAGDEVITPALTFVASANAARYCGARVVFADIVGEEDLAMDPDDVRRKLTPRTRAIVAVHYAGFPAHIDALTTLADEHGIAIVEDCAHALRTEVDGRALGSFGVCGSFSFFSNKNMTSAEGGVITTNDDAIADRVRLLRSHGMTTLSLDRYSGRAWSYDCLETGWNFRIDDIRSSLALVQLRRLSKFLERRARVRRWYLHALASSKILVPFKEWDAASSATIGYHIMPVVLPAGSDRLAVMEHLKSRGIQTSIHYPPAHQFTAAKPEAHPPLPRTEDVAARELTLPFYPKMSQENVRAVCDALNEALG